SLDKEDKLVVDSVGGMGAFMADVFTGGVAPKVLKTGMEAGETALKTGKEVLGETGEALMSKVDDIKAMRNASQLAKQEADALEYVTPKTTELTPTEYEKALRYGRITPKTATESAKYVLSDGEIEIAKKYATLMQKDPVQTSINILDKVGDLDTEVGTFLKNNNGIYNSGELKNHLAKSLEGVDDITIPAERVAKAKEIIIDNFVASLKKNDMHSLWEARKEFDRSIESAFKGSPTLQKEMKVEFRNAVQDFISNGTPDEIYKGYMKDMRNLMRLQDTVGTKAAKERAYDQIRLWIKENPKKAKAIGLTITAAGLGTVGGLAI
ncbi:MAG: hypothetical protein NUV78_01125, partial [Candidatus Zambryskibacteria bacterium]|nr:hypothetical protein [Candidatus Zambryskibacteria bacterium]